MLCVIMLSVIVLTVLPRNVYIHAKLVYFKLPRSIIGPTLFICTTKTLENIVLPPASLIINNSLNCLKTLQAWVLQHLVNLPFNSAFSQPIKKT
jgi:hypothetical protein